MHVQVANNALGIVEVRGDTWEIAQAARNMIEGSLIVPEVGDIRRWPQSPLACCVQLRQCMLAECVRLQAMNTCSQGLTASGCCCPNILPSTPGEGLLALTLRWGTDTNHCTYTTQ